MKAPNLIPHPRTEALVPSATLAINERSRELADTGKEVFWFGLGQSPFPVPEVVVQALRNNAHQKDYLPVKGLIPLREAIRAWFLRRYKLDFDVKNILIAPGSKELLFLIQMALNARLMLPAPSWVSYHPQSRMAGNPTVWIQTSERDEWCLTAQALRVACEGLADTETGLLLLNYPNNPTGKTYSAVQLQELASVAREFGLVIVSDEIYGEVDHRGAHASIASYYPEGTLITTGLSKWCGAGGWRLGVAALPESMAGLADAVASMASETYTSTSAPIQYAAIQAFSEDPSINDYLARSRAALTQVERFVREQLTACGLTMPRGEGGFYLFVNFECYREKLGLRGICDSDSLAEQLLLETGFATLPGTAFGRVADELLLRLSYVDFDGALALEHAYELSDTEVFANVCPRIKRAMTKVSHWLKAL